MQNFCLSLHPFFSKCILLIDCYLSKANPKKKITTMKKTKHKLN